MRVAVVLSVALAAACPGPRAFNCPDDDAAIDAAIDAAVCWPDVEGVVDRLDIFCMPRDRLQGRGYCRRDGVESCAMWPGSGPYRGRVYVSADVADEVPALVVHEVQHLRPSVWSLPDACADHRAECWEESC